MLSKNQLKLLRSLQRKKDRQQQQLFLVEGGKPVIELLASDCAYILSVQSAGAARANCWPKA